MISRALPVLIVLMGGMAAGAGVRAQQTITPGYWEATERVLSPITTSKVERRCIAEQDVARFMSCHINHHYSCQCPEQSYAGGEIRYRGICVDHSGAKVGIVGRGRYTPTTLHLTADITFRIAGLPIAGRASTDAHRIADACPQTPPQPGQPGRPSPQ